MVSERYNKKGHSGQRPAGSGGPKHPGIKPPPGPAFDVLLQSIPVAGIITDSAGRILCVNPRAENLLSFTSARIARKTIFDVISGSDASLLNELSKALESEAFTVIHAHCMREDRTFFLAEIHVSLLHLGRRYLCFWIRDNTLPLQLGDLLRIHRDALQNASNGFVFADVSGKINFLNKTAQKMLGKRSPHELYGVGLSLIFQQTREFKEMLDIVSKKHREWTGEMELLTADRKNVPVHVSAACVRNSVYDPSAIVIEMTSAAR